MAKPRLTKSGYLAGLQCRKYLWFLSNAKERVPPAGEGPVFDQGREVGLLARRLFPEGKEISEELPPESAVEMSRLLLAERVPMFEAAFAYNGTFARADILDPVSGGWDIVEVKSSTEVKDPNRDDVAFQRYCYEGAGVRIGRCRLMHVNKDYVLHGVLDPGLFFIEEEVTEEAAEKAEDVEERVREMFGVIGLEKFPDVEIGPQCDAPYPCPMKYVCWKKVYDVENNVFTLPRIGENAWRLFRQGIVDNGKIPADFPLSAPQRIQLRAEGTNTPHVERSAVGKFLGALKWPLYLLDFETFQTAIPLLEGTGPYRQIPFQFSLHAAASFDSEPDHFSWLWDGEGDPRESMLEKLLPLLGEKGSIVAYNAGFEKARMRECAQAFPRFSPGVDAAITRVIDLYAPFRSFSVYYPSQHGSASIKKVLPALTGGGYDALAIRNGGQASEEFKRIMFGAASREEKEKVRRDLEAYCGTDTMSMLDILRALEGLAGVK